MNNDISRRETRVPVLFQSQKFSFDFKGAQKAKRFFMRNISEKGLGCITWGSEFLGRGCTIKSKTGADYTVRWVKVRFGFLYEFGLEKVNPST